MSREPIYARNNPHARIVSVPNGEWRVQVKIGKGSKEHDPWANRSHPDTKPHAMRALALYNKAEIGG